MLQLKDFSVRLAQQQIIDNLNLTIEPGKLHVIMGPNGSGKSTLARTLAGDKNYDVAGQALLQQVDLLGMAPEERALAGLFVAFQYPVEIPGVTVMNFLKASLNAHRTAQGLKPWDASDLIAKVQEQMAFVGLSGEFLYRSLNAGFSGGEKKRCELLQMQLLAPKMVVLDETDSGLDVDAFKMMIKCVNGMRDPDRSFLVITHYEQLVEALEPDCIHIFKNGNIVQTGGSQLLEQLTSHGYKIFES